MPPAAGAIYGQQAGTARPGTARRASPGLVPSLRPKHGTMGCFTGRVSLESTVMLAGTASPRPTKREREAPAAAVRAEEGGGHRARRAGVAGVRR